MRLPNTVPIPAPDPATPTVAAPAPMNLAAVSISLDTALVWNPRVTLRRLASLTGNRAACEGGQDIYVCAREAASHMEGTLFFFTCSVLASGLLNTTETGRAKTLDPPRT